MTQFPDMPLDGLYGDAIMDHYRNPRHRTALASPDIEVEEFNPFCGDRVVLQIRVDNQGRISQVSSRSEGCSIIQATASMLAEVLLGKTLVEVALANSSFRALMRGEELDESRVFALGQLSAMKVVRQYPVRIKCALLPWLALEEGLRGHLISRD